MRSEVHDGLEDVFTPSPMDGVGPCEKIYAQKQSRQLKKYRIKRIWETGIVQSINFTGNWQKKMRKEGQKPTIKLGNNIESN